MVAISLMIEAQDGLTWPRWKRLAAAADELGFAGLFRSDHFTNGQPPDKDSLEMVVSLTYLAASTRRIHFGPLVAPVSVRHPTLLARQAAALDDLSEGRMVLGLGAGWQAREHTLFGHDLGDIPTRMARLEEGLEVVTRLLRSDAPVTFEGRFFQLRGATLLPRPHRPGGPPIMLGGNGVRRTLPLAARYADVWNGIGLTPAEFQARSAQLDEHLRAAGRAPEAVRRTMMTRLVYGHTPAALAAKLAPLDPEGEGEPVERRAARVRERRNAIIGPADGAIQQIAAHGAAGVQELMLQWFEQDDLDGLRAFAEQVLPHV